MQKWVAPGSLLLVSGWGVDTHWGLKVSVT